MCLIASHAAITYYTIWYFYAGKSVDKLAYICVKNFELSAEYFRATTIEESHQMSMLSSYMKRV